MSNVLKNRHEIVFFIQAKNTNYNGDPDLENAPRTDFESERGYMTDVSIKSRIRRYVQDALNGKEGYEVFVKDGQNLNRAIAECVLEAGDGKTDKKSKNTEEASAVAGRRFYDVRTFGAVMSTGANAGQVQGPVQFDMPLSKDPVQLINATISRCAYAEDKGLDLAAYEKESNERDDSKKRTLGKKAFAAYALFEAHAFVSANLAQKSGFTEEDLNYLLEAILNMYEFQTSASKAGMSVVGPVIIFKHVGTSDSNNAEQKAREALLGCAPSQKLFKLIDVHKKEDVEFPRDYTDYEASVNVSKLPAGVEIGFKYDAFGPVKEHIAADDEWFKEL